MNKEVIIFGIGELADLLFFYLTNDSNYTVKAFTVNKEFKNKDNHLGLPLMEFEEIENYYPPGNYDMFIAIGYKELNSIRTEKYVKAKKKGYNLGNYISSNSTYWKDIDIGDNCLIFENNVIQPFVKIGSNTIVWSGNLISHSTNIGKNCFISSHVVLGGGSKVGDSCFIGMNSSIKDKTIIGENCIIGMGSNITKDIKSNSSYIEESTKKSNYDSKLWRKFL